MHPLTLSLEGGEWSASHPGRFTPQGRNQDIDITCYQSFPR